MMAVLQADPQQMLADGARWRREQIGAYFLLASFFKRGLCAN
jgi:hypothetical protein